MVFTEAALSYPASSRVKIWFWNKLKAEVKSSKAILLWRCDDGRGEVHDQSCLCRSSFLNPDFSSSEVQNEPFLSEEFIDDSSGKLLLIYLNFLRSEINYKYSIERLSLLPRCRHFKKFKDEFSNSDWACHWKYCRGFNYNRYNAHNLLQKEKSLL